MRFGLVTYLWGQDWISNTLITNCETVGMEAVELRPAHGVEASMNQGSEDGSQKAFC